MTTRSLLAIAVLSLAFALTTARADDGVFTPSAQALPIAGELTSLPAQATRSAVQAMVDGGAQVEEVSEDEAVARAASHGVVLQRRSSNDPNYGHPWAIIKAGFGIYSEINAMAEIYVNDNWTINPHVNVGLNYSATLLGVGWRPDALCWGCKSKLGFSVGFGAEGGYRNNTDDTNDARTGVMIATSVDAEAIYRPMKHLIFTAGIRAGGGAFFEQPTYMNIYSNPQGPGPGPGPSGQPGPASQPGGPGQIIGKQEVLPARVVPTFDALLYIGVGF